MREPRFDVLFEPVKIGPVVARNRFYQVPHCNGMGHRAPEAHAAMRGIKAEGGWAVVCTEETEIHRSSDLTPYIELRIWDDGDISALAGPLCTSAAAAGRAAASRRAGASRRRGRGLSAGPSSERLFLGGFDSVLRVPSLALDPARWWGIQVGTLADGSAERRSFHGGRSACQDGV